MVATVASLTIGIFTMPFAVINFDLIMTLPAAEVETIILSSKPPVIRLNVTHYCFMISK